MGRRRGLVLTQNDPLLLAIVGMARYLSAPQVQRLGLVGAGPETHYKNVCRRLRKLAQGGLLRRLVARKWGGAELPVWTLTPEGRATAEAAYPFLRPLSQKDVSASFLEHTVLLNDTLVDLIIGLRSSPLAPLTELPFRWWCEEEGGTLQFSYHDDERGMIRTTAIKPDAILELDGLERRLFIEAETGTQSVSTADPLNTGAVISKAQRYSAYCTRLADKAGTETFYTRDFPDKLFPELVFLVDSTGRQQRVEKAIEKWRGAQKLDRLGIRVLTFADAAAELLTLIRGTPAPARARVVELAEDKALQVRDGYQSLATTLNTVVKAVLRHNITCSHPLALPPVPADTIRQLYELIKYDLLGEPREASAARAKVG